MCIKFIYLIQVLPPLNSNSSSATGLKHNKVLAKLIVNCAGVCEGMSLSPLPNGPDSRTPTEECH